MAESIICTHPDKFIHEKHGTLKYCCPDCKRILSVLCVVVPLKEYEELKVDAQRWRGLEAEEGSNAQ